MHRGSREAAARDVHLIYNGARLSLKSAAAAGKAGGTGISSPRVEE
jgi:hypothetical protein